MDVSANSKKRSDLIKNRSKIKSPAFLDYTLSISEFESGSLDLKELSLLRNMVCMLNKVKKLQLEKILELEEKNCTIEKDLREKCIAKEKLSIMQNYLADINRKNVQELEKYITVNNQLKESVNVYERIKGDYEDKMKSLNSKIKIKEQLIKNITTSKDNLFESNKKLSSEINKSSEFHNNICSSYLLLYEKYIDSLKNNSKDIERKMELEIENRNIKSRYDVIKAENENNKFRIIELEEEKEINKETILKMDDQLKNQQEISNSINERDDIDKNKVNMEYYENKIKEIEESKNIEINKLIKINGDQSSKLEEFQNKIKEIQDEISNVMGCLSSGGCESTADCIRMIKYELDSQRDRLKENELIKDNFKDENSSLVNLTSLYELGIRKMLDYRQGETVNEKLLENELIRDLYSRTKEDKERLDNLTGQIEEYEHSLERINIENRKLSDQLAEKNNVKLE